LAAFSGKLADSNHLPGFVPPVFDLLEEDGYYKRGERKISAINDRIDDLEADPEYQSLQTKLAALEQLAVIELAEEKRLLKSSKQERKIRREAGRVELDETAFAALVDLLARESIGGQLAYKDLSRAWDARLQSAREALAVFTNEIDTLKTRRRESSNALQHWIFSQYRFLNAKREVRDLPDIFAETVFKKPIAGAGECAAPKLLQFAYANELKPLALAEFWWGQAPESAIRRHKNFYPACRGKCQPILGHMLSGLAVDPNPLLVNPAVGKKLSIVYEDEHLLLVNKPAEFLSVPGKHIQDSVLQRMSDRYPAATGPLVVHRLDMSTSGLLLIAKQKDVHQHLQRQFLRRKVSKCYLAVLERPLSEDKGVVELPLRGDLTDRPRQIVCHDHGKFSRTRWEKVEEKPTGKTLVRFYPETGRTHQLRVHAAHPEGLNAPIVGDDLYGVRSQRLYLHAAWISFVHPVSKRVMEISAEADFGDW
jgi:tRNA pseudouridine32 synthase/23S rRNA pseudouridine746 synthase